MWWQQPEKWVVDGGVISALWDMEGGRTGRKVMVVADPTPESTGALQYALSQQVAENDELILIHVENPNSWKNTLTMFLRKPMLPLGPATTSFEAIILGEVDFLEEMKKACKLAQPKLRLRVEKVAMEQGKDKATTILHQCKVLGVDVLVVGQRKNLATVILGYTRGMKPIDTAEYLIDNSKCTCVGVQKKGQNGGYLLNTKTHKNFWLLA